MSGTAGSVSTATPDREFEILCDDDGAGNTTTFLRRYTVDSTGVTVPADTELDGVTAYTVTGLARRCEAEVSVSPEIDSTVQRQTGAGDVVIPAGARSVTFLVYAGSPTVSIGGGAAVGVAAGTTLTWSVDHGGERLLNAFTFTGAAGADFLVTSTREA
ncbi:hypothetical protein ACH437_23630 [Streptomyces xinghaiensis]|uniref:hypothetical protein n=1 Tax=Streptomyces xinghaiensis TaxID=1038928 RepID=UPI00379E4F11